MIMSLGGSGSCPSGGNSHRLKPVVGRLGHALGDDRLHVHHPLEDAGGEGLADVGVDVARVEAHLALGPILDLAPVLGSKPMSSAVMRHGNGAARASTTSTAPRSACSAMAASTSSRTQRAVALGVRRHGSGREGRRQPAALGGVRRVVLADHRALERLPVDPVPAGAGEVGGVALAREHVGEPGQGDEAVAVAHQAVVLAQAGPHVLRVTPVELGVAQVEVVQAIQARWRCSGRVGSGQVELPGDVEAGRRPSRSGC